MATLMWWGDNTGIRGRCDAKCHNAKEPTCVCMCGGTYHGGSFKLGGIQEIQRTEGERILRDAEARARAEGFTLDWPHEQLTLLRKDQPCP